MEKVQVDLPARIEKRFILPNSADFVRELLRTSEEVRFSDRTCVQTIYLNNDEHEVPLSSSLKARLYIPDLKNHPTIRDSEYFIDVKEATSKHHRKKERTRMKLADAVRILSDGFKLPLRPFVAVEYSRRHFRPNGTNTRITVDGQLKYFRLTEKGEFVDIGKEDYDRVEIKSGENGGAQRTEDLLIASRAIPVISKKFVAYNFLRAFLEAKYGNRIYKELPGIEIESKLELIAKDPLFEIKDLFRQGEVPGFILPPQFPFTVVSGSLNRYYQDERGVFKAMFRGNTARIIRKGKIEVVKDPYNLNCILRREEHKGESISTDSAILKTSRVLGELYRDRKAFWVDKPTTGRTYHLSLDRCSSDFGELYELEIEFAGNYNDVRATSEKEMIEDIAFLTKFMLERFPGLKVSQLTKENWLLQARQSTAQ